MGGYKAQGRTADNAMKLLRQAKDLEAAGAAMILVEGVPAIVGKMITERASVPIFGIGAGSHTHGQLLIYADMVGMYDNFTPKFVKKYASVGEELLKGFTAYCEDVEKGAFPDDDLHTYKISDKEAESFLAQLND